MQTTLVFEDINDGGKSLGALADVSSSASFDDNGLDVLPGTTVVVDVPMPHLGPGEEFVLSLWSYRVAGLDSRLDCSMDGTTFVPVASDLHSSGDPFYLDACDGHPFAVRLTYTRSAGVSPVRALVLDRLVIQTARSRPSAPGLIPLSVACGFVILGALFAATVRANTTVLTVMLATVSALVVMVYRVWPSALVQAPTVAVQIPAAFLVMLVSVALLVGVRAIGRRGIDHTGEVAFVSCLFLVGIGLRWLAVEGALGHPLSPDAETVLIFAERMAHPFDAQTREPLWLWSLRGLTRLTRDGVAASLLFSFVTSLVWLALTFAFARLYWRRPWMSAGVLALLVGHPALVVSSAQAHRTELYGICLILAAIGAFAEPVRRVWRGVFLSVASAAVVLTQMAGVLPVFAAAVWAVMRRRIGYGAVAIAAGVIVLGALPQGIYTHQRYGEAFYFQRTLVPVFYRNMEFARRNGPGCDGCPSPDEMAKSSYSGHPTTMAHYLFGLHTKRDVVVRILRGYAMAFLMYGPLLGLLLGSASVGMYLVYLLGIGVAASSRARELLLIPFASLNLLAFIIPTGIDPRLLLHCAPFMAMLVVLGAAAAGGLVRRVIALTRAGTAARRAARGAS